MPSSYIVSNESDYLASNLAIQSTSGNLQVSESNYLSSSNIGIQSTAANIIASENTYLISDSGIQSTAAVYPLLFTVSGTEIQTWVS